MATHSSILAWKISWTEEPSGCNPWGSQRVAHTHTHTYENFLLPLLCIFLGLKKKKVRNIALHSIHFLEEV